MPFFMTLDPLAINGGMLEIIMIFYPLVRRLRLCLSGMLTDYPCHLWETCLMFIVTIHPLDDGRFFPLQVRF